MASKKANIDLAVPKVSEAKNVSQLMVNLKRLQESLSVLDQDGTGVEARLELTRVASGLMNAELQIKGLADDKDPYMSYTLYLIESLATVKSIVLMLDAGEDRERLLLQFLGLAFDLAPISHVSRTTRLYLLEMCHALVEESETLPSTEVVPLIIKKLGDVREETKTFARELVRLTAERLQPALALHFFNALNSSDRELVHSQILQVASASLTAVSSVVPLVEEGLRAENPESRIAAITLLTMFFGKCRGSIDQFDHTWQSYLQRRNDKVPNVRVSWVKCASTLVSYNDTQLIDAICDKLQDPDTKVRERLLIALKKVFGSKIEPNPSLIPGIVERCRDKMEDVRVAALELLCELISNNPNHSGLVNGLWQLLYTSEKDVRIFYEYFIEHALLIPISVEDAAEKSNSLISQYNVMDDRSLHAFRAWLRNKAQAIKYYQAYLSLASLGARDSLITVIQFLADKFRVPLDAQSFLMAFPEACLSDEEMRNAFVALSSPTTTLSKTLSLLNWAFESAWSQRDARIQNFLVNFLTRRTSFSSVSQDLIVNLLKKQENQTARRLIQEIISEFPVLGLKHAQMLVDSILAQDSDLDSHLRAYHRFLDTDIDRITPSVSLVPFLAEAVNRTDTPRRRLKYCLSIMLRCDSGFDCQKFIPRLIENIQTHPVYCFQALVILASKKCELVSEHYCTIFQCIEDFFSTHSGDDSTPSRKGWPSIDEFDSSVCVSVLISRFILKLLLTLRNLPDLKDREIDLLRMSAPRLVHFLEKAKNSRSQISLAKTLILLVPRPSVTTIIENLSSLLSLAESLSTQFRGRFMLNIVRNYSAGKIGLIYLVLLFFAIKGQSKELLIDTMKNDKHAEELGVHSAIEINSRRVRRYEDLFVHFLVIISLNPSTADNIDDTAVSKLDYLVQMAVEVVACERNISSLFDAAIQLKRFQFISSYSHRNRLLWVSSELAQNALRHRASQYRWKLESVASTILITDDILVELSSSEEQMRNCKKSYLVTFEKQQPSASISKQPRLQDEIQMGSVGSFSSEVEGDENKENSTLSDISSNICSSKNSKLQFDKVPARRSVRRINIIHPT